ncbi:uncharacterized protein LOC110897273 isoform X1 [Helianthus annuus]|uniref:uncharacterized protein LOC110897273 isoform X1 n=1 Tax=Helianthus annuus TaxID=4232 RepID=UPI001652BFAA|nr:uncharacterized protein LOC110897273 isoform X1 [Helianthus annuus]
MSSRGRPLFDLNELATEEDEESDGVFCFHPQRAIPSTTHTSNLFNPSNSLRRIINNHVFSHAPSLSGFQHFIRSKRVQASETDEDQKKGIGIWSVFEKEGEWSDADGSGMPEKSTSVSDDDKSGETNGRMAVDVKIRKTLTTKARTLDNLLEDSTVHIRK